MISKWYKLKSKAMKMRVDGLSVRNIELKLGIPRSTLSGWFKKIKLDKNKKGILHKNWLDGLVSARKKAVTWHNTQKENRLKSAQTEAEKIISKLDFNDRNILELSLAMLYFGEGFKKKPETGIGNSDPLILKFFIILLKKVYNINIKSITCSLHLRMDQDPEVLKLYWSKELDIPLENFRKSSIDKRTAESKTYDSYHGVCVVRCGNVAIQRKLVYLSRIYCEEIIRKLGG